MFAKNKLIRGNFIEMAISLNLPSLSNIKKKNSIRLPFKKKKKAGKCINIMVKTVNHEGRPAIHLP